MKVNLDFVIKLGGSAITVKDEKETLKVDEIKQLAVILHRVWLRGKKFIVIHGAGSFGHHHAKAGGINKGYHGSHVSVSEVKKAFCRTRLSVCELNHTVTKELVEQGIPAVSYSMCGIWNTTGGTVHEANVCGIEALLDDGFVPVLHGDCVLDTSQGCAILSGDTIMKILAKSFSAKNVIFLTDVKGLYSAPPSQPGAKLLSKLEVSGNLSSHGVTTSVCDFDVTGGIEHKIKTSIEMVREASNRAFTVMICDANNLETACLRGFLDTGQGTTISWN